MIVQIVAHLSILYQKENIIYEYVIIETLRANVVISGEPIKQNPSVRYLGVHIDIKLKRKDHIKAVASKVTRAIAMIRYTKKSSLDIHL